MPVRVRDTHVIDCMNNKSLTFGKACANRACRASAYLASGQATAIRTGVQVSFGGQMLVDVFLDGHREEQQGTG